MRSVSRGGKGPGGRGGEASAALRALAEEYGRALRDALGDRLVSIVLYGSVARGEAQEISDVDLLVVAEGLPRGRLRRQDLLSPADARVEPVVDALAAEGIHTGVSVILKTPAEAERVVPLYLDMVEDAVFLVDRGGFFAAVLGRLRGSLARLGARRHTLGRFRYWDLKPDLKPGEIVSL